MTRRSLIRASAALAAGAPAACRPARPPPVTRERTVIVGGGLAGLHCAHRLAELGVPATIYDAAPRFCGRLLTERSTFPGQNIELGGELIDTGHLTMHELARELGFALDDLDLAKSNGALPTLDFAGARFGQADLVREFRPLAGYLDRALARIHDRSGYITYHDLNGAAELDALSLSAWLARAPVSREVRALLEVAYTCEYGLEPDESNALNLILLVSTDAERVRLLGESDERFHVHAGSDALGRALLERLPAEACEPNQRLLALRSASDGRYRLSFERGASVQEIVADRVVLALPFSLLREVELGVACSVPKRRAIQELSYGRNSKLLCGFDRRFWTDAGATGEIFTDRGFQSTWDSSRLQPGAMGVLTNYTGGAHALQLGEGGIGARASEFTRQLAQLFPGADRHANGRATRRIWPKYALSKGSYSGYRVGDYGRFAGAERERLGRIHFCGEHTSLDAQGFMEGAALSAAMAALEIAGDLGIAFERALDRKRSPSGLRILRHADELARRQRPKAG